MKVTRAEFQSAAHRIADLPPPRLPEIAFMGRSNVGKSSLINTLLNRKRLARTSTTPGRTQAVQFYLINERFYFVDLPGYGYARAPRALRASWGPLVEAYLTDRETLRAAVVILDARRTPSAGDLELLDFLSRLSIPPIVVLTKADKLSRGRLAAQREAISRVLAERVSPRVEAPVPFSSLTGSGKDVLWRMLRQRLGV